MQNFGLLTSSQMNIPCRKFHSPAHSFTRYPARLDPLPQTHTQTQAKISLPKTTTDESIEIQLIYQQIKVNLKVHY